MYENKGCEMSAQFTCLTRAYRLSDAVLVRKNKQATKESKC